MFSEILALNNVTTLLSLILFTSYLLAIFRIKSRTNVFMVLFICGLLNIILFTLIISNHKHLKEIILIIILNILALLFLLYFMANKGTMLEVRRKKRIVLYNILMSFLSFLILSGFVYGINNFLVLDHSMKTRRMIEDTMLIKREVTVSETNINKLRKLGIIDRDSHLLSEKEKDTLMGIEQNNNKDVANIKKSISFKDTNMKGIDLVENLIINRISEAVIFFIGLMTIISLFSARTKQTPTSFKWIYKIKSYLGFIKLRNGD